MKPFNKLVRNALFLLAGVGSLASCDFLETAPYDFIAPETFYKNEADCNMALAGTYYSLVTTELYGSFYACEMSNVDDLSYYTRTNNTSTQIWANDHNTSSKVVWDAWEKLYMGIKNANALLENIDKATMDEPIRNRIKGEAKFLRAYYHFLLVQGWYEVPLRKQSLDDINAASLAATPHTEALDWIIAEMDACIDLVDNSAYDLSPSHVKKNTVLGILARVCLWRAGNPSNGGKPFFLKAATYAKLVADSKKHKLNADEFSLWRCMASDKYDTKSNESIWEAEFIGTRDDGNFTGGRIGNVIGNAQRNGNMNGKGYTYSFYAGTLILWDLFNKNPADNRRDLAMAPYWLNNKDAVVKWTDKDIVSRRCGKFRREWETSDKKNKNWTPENYPLLRYADVLLMLAEAENEANQAPTPAAYAAINEVRKRAGIDPLKGLSYETFQQELRDERARELCFESLRKYDLVRWGIYEKTMHQKLAAAANDKRWKQTDKTDKTGGQYTGAKKVAENTQTKHQFFPIPAKELAVNTKLEQNKYWK
ncbi:MAG: RagB/SusD family nutrient uptake outer membrane protein [Bacteroides sp.]